jgi:hypothetical protein
MCFLVFVSFPCISYFLLSCTSYQIILVLFGLVSYCTLKKNLKKKKKTCLWVLGFILGTEPGVGDHYTRF